jgi:hypothetical protein
MCISAPATTIRCRPHLSLSCCVRSGDRARRGTHLQLHHRLCRPAEPSEW